MTIIKVPVWYSNIRSSKLINSTYFSENKQPSIFISCVVYGANTSVLSGSSSEMEYSKLSPSYGQDTIHRIHSKLQIHFLHNTEIFPSKSSFKAIVLFLESVTRREVSSYDLIGMFFNPFVNVAIQCH